MLLLWFHYCLCIGPVPDCSKVKFASSSAWVSAEPLTERYVVVTWFSSWQKPPSLREARRGEIGFILMNTYTGKGYMTEACRAALDFGFRGMGLEGVEAKSFPNNAASLRVLEKIGMRKVRRVQARLSSKGPLVELDLFEIKRAG